MKRTSSSVRKGPKGPALYAYKARQGPKLVPRGLSGTDTPDLGGAFEVDNAKKFSVKETVECFVSTPTFERLITRKNHILIGSRGSGKTTWVRMLAHDHIVLARDNPNAHYAHKALNEHLIGIYIPTNVGFVGSLKNKPWQTEAEAELYFQWRLNVHCCASLMPVLRSCIDHYLENKIERARAEQEICTQLSTAWTDETNVVTTIEGLEAILVRMEAQRIRAISKLRSQKKDIAELNDYFDSELFLPLKEAAAVTKHALSLPERAKWMICLDEAEYLTTAHHRILNTHLRVSSNDFIFKIATMPFAHHTMETNVGEPLNKGHDFEYLLVDQEPVSPSGDPKQAAYLIFARQMFERRLMAYQITSRITLQEMLGISPLIDIKKMDSPELIDGFMALLQIHASDKVILRARTLRGGPKFKNEIVRKMHGALLLAEALKGKVGNKKLGVYSGESLVTRCSDGNPRRLLRLLNSLLLKLKQVGAQKQSPLLLPNAQNEVLTSFGTDLLARIRSEGPETVVYLEAIGKWLHARFTALPLSTDQISSVRITANDGDDVQAVIRQAVQLSLLIPHDSGSISGLNETCEGEFYLAYALAPYFKIMPRKDKSIRLISIFGRDSKASARDEKILQHKQLEL